ncbi:MAG: hypothetical protein IJE93_08930 [Clostridia bacterium]|nr:hypothetical protein [Clostridia bacterium]
MIIRQNKKQSFLYTLCSLVGAVSVFWVVVSVISSPEDKPDFMPDNEFLYAIYMLGLIMTGVACVFAAVFFFRKLVSKKPIIEICDEYFYDNSSSASLGKIYWDDIEKAYIKNELMSITLNIKLKNPEEYFKNKSRSQMMLINRNRKKGYGDVFINYMLLKNDWEKLVEEFGKRQVIEQAQESTKKENGTASGKKTKKWSEKLLIAALLIVFFPLIPIVLVVWGVPSLLINSKNKKIYKNSYYYADFKVPFKLRKAYSPEFRFYNNVKLKNLPIEYTRQENGLEYFICEGTLYLFPDFETLYFNTESAQWEADYKGKRKNFAEAYDNIASGLSDKVKTYPKKLLVERMMIHVTDLTAVSLPESVFLTLSYEAVFENEDSVLKYKAPKSTKELYDMMIQSPFLNGSFSMTDKDKIVWDLYDDVQLEIVVGSPECSLRVLSKYSDTKKGDLAHRHPTVFEINVLVYKLGTNGNILCVHKSMMSGTALYLGPKQSCPYEEKQKYLFGKTYFFEC